MHNTAPPTADQEQKALSEIRLTVSDEIIPLVRPCKTAREAWVAICDQFEQKGITRRVSLKRQLFNSKWTDTVPMQTNIDTLRALALQLETVGSPVSNEDLAVVLLCSLDKRFDVLLVQMEGRPPTDITFNFVNSRLLAEYNRQVLNDSPVSTSDVPRAAFSTNVQPRRPPRLTLCTYCHRKGHTEGRCWDKEDDEGAKGGGITSSRGKEVALVAMYCLSVHSVRRYHSRRCRCRCRRRCRSRCSRRRRRSRRRCRCCHCRCRCNCRRSCRCLPPGSAPEGSLSRLCRHHVSSDGECW